MIWKKTFYISIISIAALFLLTSCKSNSGSTSGPNHFSIYLGEFKSREQVDKFKSKLNPKLLDSLRVKKIDKNKFTLLYGHYSSSFEAGRAAFNFYLDSLITHYKIIDEGTPTLDNFANILFIAKYLEKPTVYSLNLVTKQTEIAWSRFTCQVVALNQTKDHEKAYISTVAGIDKQSGFSSIHGIRIFLYRRDEDEDEEIVDWEEGTQLYTYWEHEDTLKINHSFIDEADPKNVIQKIYAYNNDGKLENTKTRKYNLLKNGFPSIPRRTPNYASPNKRFQLRTVYSQGQYYFYIKDYDQHSEELIASSRRSVNDARWSIDSRYLFIVTDNIATTKSKTEPTGELLVINVVERKLQRVFTGYRFENMLIQGRLLLYDKQFNQNSQISIYDYTKDRNYYTISMSGGCGLNNLPY